MRGGFTLRKVLRHSRGLYFRFYKNAKYGTALVFKEEIGANELKCCLNYYHNTGSFLPFQSLF